MSISTHYFPTFFFTNGDNLDEVYFGILSMKVKSNFLISYPTFSPLFAKPNPVVGYFNMSFDLLNLIKKKIGFDG